MTQRDLNRAIARATGEDIDTISRMGCVELQSVPFEREPQFVDWDDVDAGRNVAVLPQRSRRSR